MNTLLKTALAGVALVTMTGAARADLTVFGEVGLPLNPTAQIPQPGGIRLQGNYYDFGESVGIETKVYGLTAAGRVGGNLEVNGGVFRYEADISGAAAEFGDGGKETGFGIGAKYLISRETDPAGVRLAVGAGYFDVSGLSNQRVYGVATKSFGDVVTAGRTPIVGHLGVRYDRYDLDDFGDDSKVSIFAGAEVPITRDGQFQAVGELGTEIAEGGGTPYSLSLRYRPAGRPFGASIGIQRQGALGIVANDASLFLQIGYTFGR